MFYEGSIYFIIGFIKKFFLADTFATFSDPVFDGDAVVDTQSALIATLGYTFQLYFDFSGYSDMALGLARMFGFILPWNFDSPYKAGSISEFWRRWHMTLSRFLRDYIYVPLGGNRRGELSRYRNLLLTMLIGGLWHGAAWTFVLWGAMHGIGLALNNLWVRYVGIRLYGLGWLLTFSFVALLWVLFRATSVERALQIYGGFLALTPLTVSDFWPWAVAGLAMTVFAPSSHALVKWFSSRATLRPTWPLATCARRMGIYAAISSGLLLSMTAIYYTTSIDRRIYSFVGGADTPTGLSNQTGDFRNNLWSQSLFSHVGLRVMIAGSSFATDLDNLVLERSGDPSVASDTFGMGGNGIMNGARAIAAAAEAQEADVFVLAVSPLNFGVSIGSMPFPGQCIDALKAVLTYETENLQQRPLSSCEAQPLAISDYFSVFDADRSGGVYQFKNFIRNLASSWTMQPARRMLLQYDSLKETLLNAENELARLEQSGIAVNNPDNGADVRFNWRARGIIESLRLVAKDTQSSPSLREL